MNKGIFYGIGAYVSWGILPIYWKWLHNVPAGQVLAHRMLWSLVFFAFVLAYRKQWAWIIPAFRDTRTFFTFLATACIIAVNWFVYIWAINAGHIVEASLGYFINPLVSVLFGVVLLKERLRLWQWVSIAVAAGGVLYLTISYGVLPWISLALAFSFAIYGLIKKTTQVSALQGMSLETALFFVPALVYLAFQEHAGVGAIGHASWITSLLLAFTGVITAVPLLLFSAAAKKVPLSLLGILQYLAPTLQLMIGVFLYGEPFDQRRFIGFGLIWIALLVYSIEGLLKRRKRAALQIRALV